jgi:signal transduction histidine kinase
MLVAGPRSDIFRSLGELPRDVPGQPGLLLPGPALESLFALQHAGEFPDTVAAAAASLVKPLETFALLCDRATGQPDLESLATRSARQGELSAALRRYCEAPDGDGTVSRDSAAGPLLCLIPVLHRSRLEALVGVVDGHLAGDFAACDALRTLARVSAAFLAVQRDAHEMRARAEKTEAALRIKECLESNLCHEFRSLLAVVRGYSRQIAAGRAGAITEMQGDHLAVVLRNTDKLLDLVCHSLPFVMEQQFHVEHCDLREIWHGSLHRLSRRASRKSLRMSECCSQGPFLIAADRSKLSAAFDILADNAIRLTANGGEISCEFARGSSGDITFKLSAPGVELSSAALDSIFDHQDRPVSAGAPMEEPRAAGMALVHDIVWLHGGRIFVTGRSGEGTKFTLTLPPASPAGTDDGAKAGGLAVN